jgi:hypothetical protein
MKFVYEIADPNQDHGNAEPVRPAHVIPFAMIDG